MPKHNALNARTNRQGAQLLSRRKSINRSDDVRFVCVVCPKQHTKAHNSTEGRHEPGAISTSDRQKTPASSYSLQIYRSKASWSAMARLRREPITRSYSRFSGRDLVSAMTKVPSGCQSTHCNIARIISSAVWPYAHQANFRCRSAPWCHLRRTIYCRSILRRSRSKVGY